MRFISTAQRSSCTHHSLLKMPSVMKNLPHAEQRRLPVVRPHGAASGPAGAGARPLPWQDRDRVRRAHRAAQRLEQRWRVGGGEGEGLLALGQCGEQVAELTALVHEIAHKLGVSSTTCRPATTGATTAKAVVEVPRAQAAEHLEA